MRLSIDGGVAKGAFPCAMLPCGFVRSDPSATSGDAAVALRSPWQSAHHAQHPVAQRRCCRLIGDDAVIGALDRHELRLLDATLQRLAPGIGYDAIGGAMDDLHRHLQFGEAGTEVDIEVSLE